METANAGYLPIDDKGIDSSLLYDLAARCGFKVLTAKDGGRVLYKLKKLGIPCERLYTREEKSTFNFIDIADLHIGDENCEVSKIRAVLEYAVKNNVEYIFIAGDIFNGVTEKNRDNVKDVFSKQLDIAVSIFRKFPVKIFALPGNHEFTFDYMGVTRPLRMLEERLKDEKCDFQAFDGYIQDFEMAGVIKRMMHLEEFYHHDKTFAAIQRLYTFEANGGLNVKGSDGKKRPIRFLQCGHIHKTIEIYNSDFNVYISQPGSFVRGQNYYMPFIHVKGEVTDDLRILRG